MRFSSISIVLLVTAVGCGAALDPSPPSPQAVTKQASQQQIQRFQANAEGTVAVLEGRDVLESLLGHADDRGVWLLFGLDAAGHEKLVLNLAGQADVVDQLSPCPPFC